MNLGEARSLLYDILADRQHTGCCCAACCYAAYHRSRLPKGRTYAKRVFFLFDLWRNCAFYLNFDREFRRRYEPKGRIKSFWISPDSTEYRAIGKLPDPKPGEPGYYDEYGYIQVRGWSPMSMIMTMPNSSTSGPRSKIKRSATQRWRNWPKNQKRLTAEI